MTELSTSTGDRWRQRLRPSVHAHHRRRDPIHHCALHFATAPLPAHLATPADGDNTDASPPTPTATVDTADIAPPSIETAAFTVPLVPLTDDETPDARHSTPTTTAEIAPIAAPPIDTATSSARAGLAGEVAVSMDGAVVAAIFAVVVGVERRAPALSPSAGDAR